MLRSILAASILSAAVGCLSLPATPARSASPPQFTAISVAGGDGRTHLAYELLVVNMTNLVVAIDTLAVVDPASGAVLASLSGEGLRSVFRLNGHDPAGNLGPAQSALVFVDVALPAGLAAPQALVHRITTTRQMKADGPDIHKGKPLDASIPLPGQITFDTAPLPVDRQPAIRLAPPLRGPGWIAANGCCATITSHRGAAMAFDGQVQVPERFAIDFVQIGPDGRLFSGPADQVGSYRYYGVPVHAAAGGTVTMVVDGMEEQVPGAVRAGVTPENAAGNSVVVDMGGGNFALYAHLQTGSVKVRVGDTVTTGQVLGLLGNTGNSDAPHLHFHVMNGPTPLASQGLPYVFDRFTSAGLADLDDPGALDGKPVRVNGGWNAGPARDRLPLNNQVVNFD
ncbi:M23 family metallopeptidase [Alsobacter sp. R-9]